MKKSTRVILITAAGLTAIGIVLALAGVIAGASFKQIYQTGSWDTVYYDDEYDNTFRDDGIYELAAKDISDINIDWVSGDVSIISYSGSKIILEETSDGEITDKTFLRYRLKNGVLDVDYSTGKIGISLGGMSKEFNKKLCIKIPESLAAELKSIDVDAVSADIAVNGLSLDSMSIDVTSGDIRLADMNVRDFEADTISGALEAYFDSCPAELTIDSTSGDGVIYLPADSGFTVAIDGISGELETEFSYHKNSDYEYVIGDGKNSFEMDTVSGDFEILINKTASI